MIFLPKSLAAWNTSQFRITLARELELLDVEQLPLQQGLTHGSHVLDDQHEVMIVSVDEIASSIHTKVGVFFNSVIAGCNCADDPTPVEALHEYCELRLTIDMRTGAATVVLEPA